MGEGYAMSLSDMATKSIKPPERSMDRQRMVTDEEADNALHWMIAHCKTMGAAKKRLVKAGRMITHAEAIGYIQSTQKTGLDRKYDARTTEQYLKWAEEEADAAGDYEEQKALHEAADLKIQVWRTQSASMRAAKI